METMVKPSRLSRQAAWSRRQPWAWVLIPGLVGCLLLGLALVLGTINRSVELTISAQEMQPLAGHAVQVDLKRRISWPWQGRADSLFDSYRSTLMLFEDGRPLGPPHARFDAIQRDGGGGYLHWAKLLVFSTPDHSDPRTNGRVYRATFKVGVARPILRRTANIGGLLVLWACGALLWNQRRAAFSAMAGRARHLRTRYRDYALAAVVPTGVSLLCLSLLPPLWNGSDSTIWLFWQLSWIPHHPPVYPLFMALVTALFDGAPQVLRATQWVQHLAYILAIAYLASAYRVRWQILLMSA
ncbi:MAG TPA: hypothetical protein VES73_01020, partial [Lamprocystis sp. (in: g-proteobacteria)]|nr:hypothetical protein [Lamprocystis sp. (in: g-proteobacteria)]